MAEPTDGLRWVQIRRRRDLSATAKLVWRTIERICLRHGCARVGQRWLAMDVGEPLGNAQRAITSLVSFGLITVENRGRQRSIYRIPSALPTDPPSGQKLTHQRVTNCSTSGSASDPPAGQECSTSGSDSVPPAGHDPHDNTTIHDTERERREQLAFDTFWRLYPRKVGKAAAERAWRKGKCTKKWGLILVALERHKKLDQWNRDGGQFIPHASTWLNQRRWEDQVEETEPRHLSREEWAKQPYCPG